MLQSIRDRAHGLVAAVIIFFICMTFALWGIQEYLEAGSQVIVAEVNGDEIELGDFQKAYQRYRQQAQELLGEAFDPVRWQQAEVRKRALDQLIEERVLSQTVDKAGFRIGDSQVQNQLRRFPTFHENGGFSAAIYKQRVRLMGFSEIGFEQRVRNDMAIQQLQSGIAGSEFVTPAEVRQFQLIKDQKRDIGYAVISADRFKDGIALTDEDVAAYYDAHKNEFVTADKVSLQYIELSLSTLMEHVPVDESTIQKYYHEHEANYTVEEQRSANHILIQVPPGSGPEAYEVGRQKAEKIRELALKSDNFEQLARDNSDDIGSRADGGATGFFGRGVMAPEFEKAVFGMSVGEISEPVKTEFGYHVIRLKEIREGGIKPFDQVRDDVGQAYRREQAEQLYFDQAERFSNLVYENPDSLAVAAETLGLELRNTEPSTREELSTRFSSVVAAAAFSEEVLGQGLNSEPLEAGDERILAVRVNEHIPSRTLAQEEVRDAIVTDVTDERAREAARDLGGAVSERLQAGEQLESVVKDKGLDWKVAEQVGRESTKVSRAVVRAAFKLPVPSEGSSTFSGAPIGTGDYAVIQVSNVRSPEIEQVGSADTDDLKKEIEQSHMAARWRSFVRRLTELADVETYPDNL